jgi:tetratricopeptide (TPR) repeat protein
MVEEPEAAEVQVKTTNLPQQELTTKILYQLLLAEIASQRDRLGLATTTYLDLAKSTRDPRVAQRATEVALYARQSKAALEAALLWAELDPDSMQARQTISALLVNEGKLDEARPYLDKLLAAGGSSQTQAFMHLNALLAKHADKNAVLGLVQDLARPYQTLPEARYAVAVAALNAKKPELAISEARAAEEMRPGWEAAAVLEGQALQNFPNDAATAFYKDFLQHHPRARDVRLTYARYLVDQRSYNEARDQFQQLLRDAPGSPDVTLAVGLLSMQLEDYDSAQTYLERVLDLNYKDPNAVRFYLGQLNEDRKRYAEAAHWYGLVEPGEQYLAAQIKVATMLARQNHLEQGREYLSKINPENNQQRAQLILADAQLLRDAKDYKGAFDALTHGLDLIPNSPDLLYDRAMVAEKMQRLDLLEHDLRKVIEIKPDHAHAYNALGYTLADRTDRYGEALELIQKAISLAPGDPYILDSLGWVQYRMGNLGDAAANLRSAYQKQADPEIAAHLGEVLWVQGNRDEAKKIWHANFKDHPDNEVLSNVIKKFNP